MAVVESSEPGQQFDREFLAHPGSGSTAVTLAGGEQRTQDLRIK